MSPTCMYGLLLRGEQKRRFRGSPLFPIYSDTHETAKKISRRKPIISHIRTHETAEGGVVFLMMFLISRPDRVNREVLMRFIILLKHFVQRS